MKHSVYQNKAYIAKQVVSLVNNISIRFFSKNIYLFKEFSLFKPTEIKII
jgi:hypothetical protein